MSITWHQLVLSEVGLLLAGSLWSHVGRGIANHAFALFDCFAIWFPLESLKWSVSPLAVCVYHGDGENRQGILIVLEANPVSSHCLNYSFQFIEIWQSLIFRNIETNLSSVLPGPAHTMWMLNEKTAHLNIFKYSTWVLRGLRQTLVPMR